MWTFPAGGNGSGHSSSRSRHSSAGSGHSSKARKTRTKDLSHYTTFGEVPRNHVVELLFNMERQMNPMHLESATTKEIFACFYQATGRLPSSLGLGLSRNNVSQPAVCYVNHNAHDNHRNN